LLTVGLALPADGDSVRPPAAQPGQVTLALNLAPANGIITAGEPVIAHIEVTNVTDHEVEVVRGYARRPTLVLEIWDSESRLLKGTPREPLQPRRPRRGPLGSHRIGPGKSYEEFSVVTEMWHFGEPGQYLLHARLLEFEGEQVLAEDTARLKVEPFDAACLEARCDQLFHSIRDPSRGTPARDTWLAKHALQTVRGEVALPYLDYLARRHASVEACLAIRRVGTPRAQQLIQILAAREDEYGEAARRALETPIEVPSAHETQPNLAKEREPDGFAAVINMERVPNQDLVDLQLLRTDPLAFAQACRARGLFAVLDASERSVAVVGPAGVPGSTTGWKDLSSLGLASIIVQNIPLSHLTTGEPNYLPVDSLPEPARTAALALAQRDGLADQDGSPTRAGAQLCVRLWFAWQSRFIGNLDRQTSIYDWSFCYFPPTSPAVAQPPLTGSVFWWMWDHAEADWGDQPVSVEPGDYPLRYLLRKLAEATGRRIFPRYLGTDPHLRVVAERIPLRNLLWAIRLATGLRVEATSDTDPVIVTVGQEASPGNPRRADAPGALPILGCYPAPCTDDPGPLPTVGYYTPVLSPTGRALLREGGATLGADRTWIGWRFRDMPLMYRSWISEGWEERQRGAKQLFPLDADRTLVIWTKGIWVGVELRWDDSCDPGSSFIFPAL